MRSFFNNPIRFALPGLALAVAMAAGLAWAQDPPAAPQAPATWRHMGDQAQLQAQDPEPVDRAAAQSRSAPPACGLPPQLTMKPGTYVNIRLNQALSSSHSKAGDTFTASLVQAVIVDGVVVAPRGQVVYGRIAEAEKAHNGQDSRLGLELTSLTLADGNPALLHTQLVAKPGAATPRGISSEPVVSTPAAGAAPVLTNHSHATELYPGTVLTFSVTAPVTVATANASQAFRYAGPEDYQTNVSLSAPRTVATRPTYVYGPGYSPYYYPYYWGPSIGIGFGGRYGRFWR